MCLLGALNSSLFQDFISIGVGAIDGAARSYQVGLVQSLPWIRPLPDSLSKAASASALKCVNFRRNLDISDEVTNLFVKVLDRDAISLVEALSSYRESASTWTEALSESFVEIERLVNSLFDVATTTAPTRSTLESSLEQRLPDKSSFVAGCASYLFGCAFGRWDIRYVTGEQPTPELPDPFAPLPVCPPGMLQGDDGLPLSPEAGCRLRTEGRYPLDVAWGGGILVDVPEHPIDLEYRIRAAVAVIWGDRTDALEHETCVLLGVPNLREWFQRPGGFFADHLKRYSKSRRQAPIYWPLSTASGSYTIWLYYHRLNEQTLHTVLADFLDPKLKAVRAEIEDLREKPGQRARFEALIDLERDLLEMRAEIERVIKLPWKPNLNDGVLITASPLWKLFRLPKWRKDLEACWKDLERGDYDWAHLALSLWPDRVSEKCKTDRSLAIAHGLEDLCQVAPPAPKAKRGKKKP